MTLATGPAAAIAAGQGEYVLANTPSRHASNAGAK